MTDEGREMLACNRLNARASFADLDERPAPCYIFNGEKIVELDGPARRLGADGRWVRADGEGEEVHEGDTGR